MPVPSNNINTNVSVIIPCYCASGTLWRAVNSVLSQTVPPKEIILVDDASPDNGKTKNVINEVAQHVNTLNMGIQVLPIFLLNNIGPGGARNAGWAIASQEWLAFLDADDSWHPEKLHIQTTWLGAHPEIILCGHTSEVFNEDADLILVDELKYTPVSLIDMLISNSFPTRSVLLRSHLSLRFIEDRCEDYYLWLSVISAGMKAARLNLPLAFCYREEFSPGGYSANLWEHEKGELRCLLRLQNSGNLSLFLSFFAIIWSLLKYLRRLIRCYFRYFCEFNGRP